MLLRRLPPLVASLLLACSIHAQQLPAYAPQTQVSGVIHTAGSPQMSELLKLYEAGFNKLQPAVQFDDDLQSTITAITGVSNGHATIGLLGREIWPSEQQAFASLHGHPPLVIEVATGSYDVPKATFALMVFVPHANPIASLSLQQLDRVFSNTATQPVRTWGDLGLHGVWATRPVHLYGFRIDNDKSRIFAQLVFRPGERWNPALREFSNAAATQYAQAADAGDLILRALAAAPDAIAISNVHYATTSVKALPLTFDGHRVPVTPSPATVESRLYPLSRAVYFVVNADAAHPLSASTAEFLRFVLSEQGRQAVLREGNYLPLTHALVQHQLQSLESAPQSP